ncbi:MAG: hypothetical protein LBM71_04230 [Elusimicrobiota bacterium]|jgi:hypothetical protein|nr:hypothetical protein [Elusimicrobiota bacterium]
MEENKKSKIWDFLSKATEISILGFLISLILSTTYTFAYFAAITFFDFTYFHLEIFDILKISFSLFPNIIISILFLFILAKLLYLPGIVYLFFKKKDITVDNMRIYALVIILLIFLLGAILLANHWDSSLFVFFLIFILMLTLCGPKNKTTKYNLKNLIFFIIVMVFLLGTGSGERIKKSENYSDYIDFNSVNTPIHNIKIIQTTSNGVVFLNKKGEIGFVPLDNINYYLKSKDKKQMDNTIPTNPGRDAI